MNESCTLVLGPGVEHLAFELRAVIHRNRSRQAPCARQALQHGLHARAVIEASTSSVTGPDLVRVTFATYHLDNRARGQLAQNTSEAAVLKFYPNPILSVLDTVEPHECSDRLRDLQADYPSLNLRN